MMGEVTADTSISQSASSKQATNAKQALLTASSVSPEMYTCSSSLSSSAGPLISVDREPSFTDPAIE